MIPPYPLHWPEGIPRTTNRQVSQFKTTLSAAMANVQSSIRLFGRDTGKQISNIIVSSNVTLGPLA